MLYSISISYKTAPVEIRQLFSFSAEEQTKFLEQVIQDDTISECVFLSTCNRSEVYFTGEKQAVTVMEQYLAKFKGLELELLMKYFLVFREEKAVRHLFSVTCGMDSMLIGEDEILGQVKDAYQRALNLGMTQYVLNTLFRSAVTCSKKIKTDTKLSKTPVSIGTLVANEIFHFPKEKKQVLIIGLTGKMGTIIMKNIYGRENIEIIGTSRSHNSIEEYKTDYKRVKVIDYKDRYQYMDKSDIIISATTSPHYTVTRHELEEQLNEEKERLFIDLAVPMDIDKEIAKMNKVTLADIDYFEAASRTNNERKLKEIERAQYIMEEQIDELLKEFVFHDFLPDLPKIRPVFEEKDFLNILYEIKESADSMELTVVLKTLRKLI